MFIIYDPTLVLLSIFVAIIGSLTGLALTFGYDAPSMVFAPKSLIRGAVIIGGSIWSMHFVAMLAVKFPVAISYNSLETLLSLCVAIFFTASAWPSPAANRSVF
jgi:diguanylate cyclase